MKFKIQLKFDYKIKIKFDYKIKIKNCKNRQINILIKVVNYIYIEIYRNK